MDLCKCNKKIQDMLFLLRCILHNWMIKVVPKRLDLKLLQIDHNLVSSPNCRIINVIVEFQD